MGITAEDLENEEIDILALGETAESISEFGLGIRDESAPNHWREAKENLSFKDKKTILILPGSGTRSAEQANGMCKIVQKMLPEDKRKDFQICSMYYQNGYTMRTPTVIRAEKLLDNYIVPLIATKDKNGDLHRISAAKAAHNMRNLMVVTHCYGCYILQEIDKHLNYLMEDLGYLADERKFIQKQLIAVQHNSIDISLGDKDFHFTNFIRLSSSDEDVSVKETKLGTFYHYLKAKEPAKGEVLYLKLSDNVRALLVESVTKLGVSDHNGGYWKSEVYKTAAGKKEEQLFKAIFQETATTNYLVEDAEQLVRNAMQKQPQQNELMTEAVAKGKAYKSEFKQFAKNLQAEYQKAEKSMTDENFRAENLSKEVLLMQNDRDYFLLDKALRSGNYKTAENIAVAMFDKLPKLQFTRFGYEQYMPYPQNQNEEDALAKAPKWAQHAVKTDSVAMFKAVLPILRIEKLKKLDFTYASEAVMNVAVQEILQKENPSSLDRQEYFSQAFTNIYAQAEKLPESDGRTAMLKRLNQRVLAPANGMQQPMSYYMLEKMQTFAEEQKVEGLLKVLRNCSKLQNAVKDRSSMVKNLNMR